MKNCKSKGKLWVKLCFALYFVNGNEETFIYVQQIMSIIQLIIEKIKERKKERER